MRFNDTRTSEDYGYNLAADLLCDNGAERTAAVGEVVVNVCGRPGSITSAAGRNFEWDQRVCSFVDNTIWAVDLARRHRPGSDRVTRSVLHALLVVYVKLCCIRAQAPWYAEQAMEYAKKFYHLCYRRWYVPAFASMESKLGPETTGVIIRAFAGQDYLTPPADFEPELGFDEFMGAPEDRGVRPGPHLRRVGGDVRVARLCTTVALTAVRGAMSCISPVHNVCFRTTHGTLCQRHCFGPWKPRL